MRMKKSVCLPIVVVFIFSISRGVSPFAITIKSFEMEYINFLFAHRCHRKNIDVNDQQLTFILSSNAIHFFKGWISLLRHSRAHLPVHTFHFYFWNANFILYDSSVSDVCVRAYARGRPQYHFVQHFFEIVNVNLTVRVLPFPFVYRTYTTNILVVCIKMTITLDKITVGGFVCAHTKDFMH